MMARLTDEDRQRLRADSEHAASAFLEDMPYIREIVTRFDPGRDNLRRLSATLRRLLIERDLTTVASPRIGKIALSAYDNNHFYSLSRNFHFQLFMAGGGEAFGFKINGLCVPSPPNFSRPPEPSIIHLKLDGFLSQKIFCIDGHWVTRAGILKYVANVASGVHSGTNQTDEETLISKVRNSITLSGKEPQVSIHLGATGARKNSFAYGESEIDCVLIEILTTAQLLASSPDVKTLEEAVKAEFK